MPLVVGTRLGPYEVLRQIGAGGMGEVYKARDTRLDRAVALKVLRSDVLSPERRLRFQREARAISALSHPHICVLHDIGCHDGTDFLVMEYVEGRPLSSRIGPGGLPLASFLPIAIQLTDAVGAAHQRGIVHRDLKPANVMVTDEGHVKVLDFGLARLGPQPGDDEGVTDSTANLTAEGRIAGTVAYMSPEQAEGRAIDHRSDIFSVGVVLYEMATGKRPFTGDSAVSVLSSILKDTPRSITDLNPRLPRELARVVDRCLAKDRERRYQNAKDLRNTLEELRRDMDSGHLTTPRASAGADERARSQVAGSNGVAGRIRRTLGSGRRWLWLAPLLLLVVGGALVAAWRSMESRDTLPFTGGRKASRSLAVLPLQNLSGDAQQEWFADGVTEELTSALSQVSALRVVSGISARHYKGSDKTALQIARELGDVQLLFGGSVRRDDDRMRVSVYLDEVGSDRRVWTRSYERGLGQGLDLFNDVARNVALELGAALTPSEGTRLATADDVKPDAYVAYLQGLASRDRQLDGGCIAAEPHFLQAIALDPDFAQPHAALAFCYGGNRMNNQLPAAEALAKGHAEAARALELDEQLAEAHASLGMIRHRTEYDWAGAERSFKRALTLNPGYPEGLVRYGELLYLSGRVEDGLAMIRRGVALVPFNVDYHVILGYALYNMRRFDEAVDEFERAGELDPSGAMAPWCLARLYTVQRREEEAIAAYLAALRQMLVPDRAPAAIDALEAEYRQRGWDGFTRKELELAEEGLRPTGKIWHASSVRGSGQGEMAWRYLRLGETDRAIASLEAAYEQREGTLVCVRADPRFDNLHADPRFQDLVRRVGIPQ